MKLSLLFIILTAYQLQANVYAQQVNINVRQTQIRKILALIEKDANVRFLYNYALSPIEKKIDYSAVNLDVNSALNKLFLNSGLTYRVLENNLIVVLKEGEASSPYALIRGKVTDENGMPLIGVAVTVKGTNQGTVTGSDGSFTINASDDAVLVISYVGYEQQEVSVSGRTTIDVQLQPSNNQMEQVVVVGYGTQRKKDVTGAVSIINAEDIANRPIVNASEALQGKAAGVQVTSNSGKPGAGLTIRIRGSSSISAGNDPLYVVDGIPMTDISWVTPNDIESFSILKDAASAAIYGTRAANGVVLITTKKGARGKSRIEFSTYYGITSTTKKIDVLNATQYQEYMNETFGPGTISDSLVKANNVNWPDEVFRNGHQVNYQLAISGGNEKTQHYISFGYSDQVGMIRPATFDRFSGRINLTSKVTDWLTFSTNSTVSRTHNNDVTDNASIARGGVVLSALATPPTVPKYNADGSIAQNPLTGWENPLGSIEGQRNKNTNDRIVSNVGADVKLLKGLVFKSKFGIDYENHLGTYFEDPFLTQDGRNNQGQLSQTKSVQLVWLSEQTLNYANSWGKNNFTVLAGWTAQDSKLDQTNISASQIETQYRHLPWESMYVRAHTKAPASKTIDEWSLISYLGRLTYDFDGKYLLQANFRSDRSSKFAPGNRNATFPSFSAGWRISEENFMKDIPVISDLKLRAGWGQNGNQEGLGSYEYLSLTRINNQTGATEPSTLAPEDLTWETTTQTNIGVDAGFLGNRLTFTGDFYTKRTEDVLVRIFLPGSFVPSVVMNMGTMRNTGFEFGISNKNIVGRDLNWNTDLNISFNKNEVLEIGNGIPFLNTYGYIYERGNAIALQPGYGLGQFYGYVSAGVDPATGDQLYLSKDGKAVNNTLIKPSDKIFIGSAQPKFVYGMTNNLSYKNFDLTVFLQGSQGNKIFNGVRVEMEGMKDSRNQSTDILGRWRKSGDVTDIPGVKPYSDDNTQISTRFLENGSYLRFKTITLAYRFNPALIERLGLGSASIYVSGQNLITITKYKGFDPEVNTYGGDGSTEQRNVALGVDYGAYPQAKMFLFGLNVSLK